jgi:N-acetylglucosaminyldiphosphoundecaprenol N-acetyl-beta-D-mannosaminyltransferase
MKTGKKMSEESLATRKRLRLLGVPVDAIDIELLDEALKGMLVASGAHQVVFLRTMDLLRARRNPELLCCLEQAALVVPVSRGLRWACQRLHLGDIQRIAPFDFMIRMLNVLEGRRGSYYLLGDHQPYLNRMELNLKQTFPGAQALGRYASGFNQTIERNIRIAIAKASPNLLIAGNGLLGKDLWLFRRASTFPRGVQIWSGECFEYFTARRKRPNRVSFRNGHEFYQESLCKPWRWFRFPLYVWFHLLVLAERIRHPRPVQA